MSRIIGILLVALIATLAISVAASATVSFFTAVGGASGMTMQLSPFATGGVQRGCASKMMDMTLQQKNIPPGIGTVKQVYTSARMRAGVGSPWSEPTGPWATGQVKFTGDKSQCEINYIHLTTGDYLFALVIRADSVIGLRWICNRQYIWDFVKLVDTAPDIFVDSTGAAASDPDWLAIKQTALNMLPANGGAGIPIEGGLTECYMDSGVKAIDRYNRLYPAPVGGTTQPQLNPANFAGTKDNILAVAVMAIIYHNSIEQWSGGEPVNFTNQMERMISAGMADNWDIFFSAENGHMPLLNYYREPLSGTGITYLNLIMRGLETKPNGTNFPLLPVCATDGVNYHRSGIPDLDCVYTDASTCPAYKPGGGAVNNAVNSNAGSHAYTFLQKFTDNQGASPLTNIRVAEFNGYSPYDFSAGNSLPGINGVPDVDDNTTVTYYQNVLDGKYPLWTYNHCFDATNGASTNLADYVANYNKVAGAELVRAVGLIALSDMDALAGTRTISPSGPNAGRGPGLGRCGFRSPVTGEFVRDGMMFMLNDSNAPDDLPGEGYVEMRP